MFNPFALIRTLTRNAVMNGIGDALAELQPAPADASATPLTLADVSQRLAINGPPTENDDNPEDERPAKRGKK